MPAAARRSSGPAAGSRSRALPPRRHVDPTGCGDTYLAAYMTRRLSSDDLRACGDFAAAVASLKLEQVGPFRGTAADIAARLALTAQAWLGRLCRRRARLGPAQQREAAGQRRRRPA